MKAVLVDAPVLAELTGPSPNQIFNIGLQMAQEIDAINRENGVRSCRVVEWKRKYGKKFGGV